MKKLLWAIFLFLLICLSSRGAETDYSDCMPIAGSYHIEGKNESVANFKIRLDKDIFGIENDVENAHHVVINDSLNGRVNVSIRSIAGDELFLKKITYPYVCKNKKVTYESKVEGSGDGSSVISTEISSSFYKDNIGSLVVDRISKVTVRKWFLNKKTEASYEKYKFRKINGVKLHRTTVEQQ